MAINAQYFRPIFLCFLLFEPHFNNKTFVQWSHLFDKTMQFIHVLKYTHYTRSESVANHSHCVRLWLTKVGFCYFPLWTLKWNVESFWFFGNWHFNFIIFFISYIWWNVREMYIYYYYYWFRFTFRLRQ